MTNGGIADEETIARITWLSEAHHRYRPEYLLLHLSSHGLLLQVDVERAFIAGAWASVIVTAQAVIEATLRDIVELNYGSNAKSLFKGNRRLERIRMLRNEILHPQQPGSPSLIWRIGGGNPIANHARLEPDAKRAIEYMLYLIYKQNEK
jgi:hypothetical protein